MHSCYKLIAGLLAVCAAIPAMGAKPATFENVSWTPRSIEVGAPCLFTVRMSDRVSSVTAKWQGRDLVFSSRDRGLVWYGLAGVDVEARPGNYRLELDAILPDGRAVHLARDVRVGPSSYKTVKLTVPERFVQPDPEALKKIALDQELKKEAFSHQTPGPEWSGSFHVPVDSTVSEAFGTRRTFNGKLASIHRGVDYHAREGTPVVAANAGTVVLARELYYEGNCVILDHGQQFMTLYMHLSHIEVTEGEKVKEGQLIGLSGATGRATGPHLHVAVRWQGAYLDPTQLWRLSLPALP